jgi:hypothetical protein
MFVEMFHKNVAITKDKKEANGKRALEVALTIQLLRSTEKHELM